MKYIQLIILNFLILLTLSACVESHEAISLQGTIVEVLIDDTGQPATLFVEGEILDDHSYRRVYVTIENQPEIYNQAGESLTINDLKKGLPIKIIFENIVLESSPIQGTARTIKL